jgi:hypothetical protein
MTTIIFYPFPSNGAPVEWNWQGKTEVLGGKTCPSATLSTTNPTWTGPGSNPGLRGGRPAVSRLSHGTALCPSYFCENRCQLNNSPAPYTSEPSFKSLLEDRIAQVFHGLRQAVQVKILLYYRKFGHTVCIDILSSILFSLPLHYLTLYNVSYGRTASLAESMHTDRYMNKNK